MKSKSQIAGIGVIACVILAFASLTQAQETQYEIATGPQASVYNLGDAATTTSVANDDIIEGVTATIVSGGFYSGVATATSLEDLTNGVYDLAGTGGLLRDNTGGEAAIVLEYNFAALNEIATIDRVTIFGGHDNETDGGRGWINALVEVDSGSGYAAPVQLTTGPFGSPKPEASVVSNVSYVPASAITDVVKVRITLYDVSHNSTGIFRAHDDNVTDGDYPNQGAIIKEIDIIGSTVYTDPAQYEFITGPKASVYDLGDAATTTSVATDDIIAGMVGVITEGGFYAPHATATSLEDLTNGVYDLAGTGGLLQDGLAPNPSMVVEYDFVAENKTADISKIVVFGGHDNETDGGRGWINVVVEADTGSGYAEVAHLLSGTFGDPKPNASVVSNVSYTPGLSLQDVEKIRFVFHNVSHSSLGAFQDPNDNTTDPPANYPDQGSIIKEIDIIGVANLIPPPPLDIDAEVAADLAGLTTQPANDDDLNGIVGVTIGGSWHTANPAAADREPSLTDGAWVDGGVAGLFNDFPGEGTPGLSMAWDLGGAVNLTDVTVVSQNADARGYHHYDVYVTSDATVDAGSVWQLVALEVVPTTYGAVGPAASRTTISDSSDGVIAEGVTGLRIDFYATDNTANAFVDVWGAGHPNDVDGGGAGISPAAAASVIKEVDANWTSNTAVDDWKMY